MRSKEIQQSMLSVPLPVMTCALPSTSQRPSRAHWTEALPPCTPQQSRRRRTHEKERLRQRGIVSDGERERREREGEGEEEERNVVKIEGKSLTKARRPKHSRGHATAVLRWFEHVYPPPAQRPARRLLSIAKTDGRNAEVLWFAKRLNFVLLKGGREGGREVVEVICGCRSGGGDAERRGEGRREGADGDGDGGVVGSGTASSALFKTSSAVHAKSILAVHLSSDWHQATVSVRLSLEPCDQNEEGYIRQNDSPIQQ